MSKNIDENGSFRSFWRSISTKKIDLNRDGISFDQNDQKPTSNDRDRSPKNFISRKTCQEVLDSEILSEKMGSSAVHPTPILEEEQVAVQYSKNERDINYWLLRLDNLKYQPAGPDKDKAILEINEILEDLVD